MAQVINTNVQSLNAQRNLNNSAVSLATSLQRLSSGLRINSAKDDAAGLAISERFSTQIRGLNVAVRNANDGISLSQTAEGALGEISSNLQRIRELAVQARNATNSASDRAALNAEVQQRLAEIDRTASQTSFNGQKILDGSFGNATFQVGSNAGETIGLSLATSTRLTEIGKIASATSGSLGAANLGGSVAITTGATENYSQAASAATFGSLTLTPATRDFSQAANAAQVDGTNSFNPSSLTFGAVAVDGTSEVADFGRLTFGTPAAPQVDGTNVQGGGAIADFDYSGAGLAQFDVDGTAITLTQNYGTGAALAADIQSQLQANGATANYTASFAGGSLTITNTGSTAAVVVSNTDANAQAANFADSAGTGGTPAAAGNNASFTVDGATVTLAGNYATNADLAAAIETQLGVFYNVTAAAPGGATGNGITISRAGNPSAVVVDDLNDAAGTIVAANVEGAGVAGSAAAPASFQVDGNTVTLNTTAYADEVALAAHIQSQLDAATAPGDYTVAGVNGGSVTITNAGSTSAVAITGANAAATAGGITNSAGTAGSAAQSATNATFAIGGHTINLTTAFGSYDDLAAEIQTQLNTASPGSFTVTNEADEITVTRTGTPGAGSLSVDVTGANAYAGTVGLGNQTGDAGDAEVLTGSVAFAVDGTNVTLSGNYADRDALASAIGTQLGSSYTVASTGSGITITNNTAGSDAPVITAGAGQAGTNATSEGFLAGTGTDGTVGGTVTLAAGEFTIQGATGDAIDFAGNYSSLQKLADEINSRSNGVFASLGGPGNSQLQLRSSQNFTVGGTEATGDLGFTQTSVTATGGSLSTVNVSTVAAADEAILRIDSALQSVSSLRSDFGAIQNRFESTIANLQGTAENLSASRSRILDADFAAETANLTRAQILQQAGVAILSQANQLPQNVLSLLR